MRSKLSIEMRLTAAANGYNAECSFLLINDVATRSDMFLIYTIELLGRCHDQVLRF